MNTKARLTLPIALACLLPGSSGRAQEPEPIRIAVLPVHQIRGELVEPENGLRDALNRVRNARFNATSFQAAQIGQSPPYSDTFLKEFAEREPFDNYLLVEARRDTLWTARVFVRSRQMKVLSDFQVQAIREEELVQAIADNLVVHIAKNIRIAMLEFPMRGGDAELRMLERALPNMLGTGLSLSPRLVLLESLDERELEEQKEQAQEDAGLYNLLTIVRYGNKLNANYLIMGEYWELEGDLRIDVRCVNIESGEIVVAHGINIDDISIPAINERMTLLAAELRGAIESDYERHAGRPRYIAVSGVPPYPETAENRDMAANMIKALSRKLQVLSIEGLRVRENPDAVREFLHQRQDNWLMSNTLNADILLTLELDRTRRDHPVIRIDRFDADDPTDVVSWTETARIDEVDPALRRLVERLLESEGHNPPSDSLDRMDRARYRGSFRTLGFGAQTGAIVRNSSDLFLEAGAGFFIELGLAWHPFATPNVQVKPLNLRLNLIGSQPNRKAIGADVWFVTVQYGFRPYHALNPYVGSSVGLLGVYRDAPTSSQYDARVGLGARIGLDHRISGTFRLNYEVEYSLGLAEIPGSTVGGLPFGGGRPGGLHLSVGTGFGL